jgi:hypothetical protein
MRVSYGLHMRRLVIPIALGVAILVAALTAPNPGHALRQQQQQQPPARSLMSSNR